MKRALEIRNKPLYIFRNIAVVLCKLNMLFDNKMEIGLVNGTLKKFLSDLDKIMMYNNMNM